MNEYKTISPLKELSYLDCTYYVLALTEMLSCIIHLIFIKL